MDEVAGSSPVASTTFGRSNVLNRFSVTMVLVWFVMEPADLAWLAGLLEGEGCFLRPSPSKPNQPAVVLQMVDEDVVARAARLMGVGYHHFDPANPRHKRTYVARLKAGPAVALMRSLRPLLGIRRRGQIDAAVSTYRGDLRRTLSAETVVEIKRLIGLGLSQWTISHRLKVNRSSVAMIAAGKRHVAP